MNCVNSTRYTELACNVSCDKCGTKQETATEVSYRC